jgi:hypothetical protein
MKLAYILSVSLVIGSLLNACVEQVEIEKYLKSKPSGTLAVEGLITNELRQHQVRLTRSGSAIPEGPYEPVSEAEVIITDGTQAYSLSETPSGSGIYLTDSIKGEINRIYVLTIKVNGEVYEASDVMLPIFQFTPTERVVLSPRPNHPGQGYIQTPLIVFGSNVPAMVSTHLDNPQPSDKFTRMDYYVFPGVDPDNILPSSVEATLSYEEGTRLTQRKYSLSHEHYLFLRALLLETEQNGGIFGSIRSNIPTNVSNGALGFFGASNMIERTGVIGPDGLLRWQ